MEKLFELKLTKEELKLLHTGLYKSISTLPYNKNTKTIKLREDNYKLISAIYDLLRKA